MDMKVRTHERQLVISDKCIQLKQEGLDYSLQIMFESPETILKVKPSQTYEQFIPIKALYGMLSLTINDYLIVVTKSEVVSQVLKQRIYRIKQIKLIVLNSTQNPLDISLKEQIADQLSNGSYYFSDEYNLTRRLSQHQLKQSKIVEYYKNNRYIYNFSLIKSFFKLNLIEWITPFIHGSVEFNYFTVFSTQFNCSLMILSRLDRQRQGARWFSRGCDDDGHTSFKVETQTVFTAVNSQTNVESVFSLFQIRSQVPLVWNQQPDIMLEPEIRLLKNQKINIEIIKKFMLGLKERDQHVCLINLLDKKNENQKRLGEYYQSLLRMYPLQTIRYNWLDFKVSDYEMNLSKIQSIIIDKLRQFIRTYNYYHMQIKSTQENQPVTTIKNTQKGVIRMTSMDGLIRIDIAQRIISKFLLQKWVYQLGIVTDKLHTHLQKFPQSMNRIFDRSWAINSHRLSKIYTGTTNIKQNSIARIENSRILTLRDGYVVVKRYILGTFYDWNKQNTSDILLGKLNCKGKIIRTGTNKYFVGVVIMVILIVWGVFQLIEEALEDSKVHNIFPIQVFWSLMAVLATFIVIKNNKFLPKPQLHY